MDSRKFRQQVIEAKERTNMSVAEIARRAGLKYDNVRDLIRRENSTTSIENATAIAGVLDIPLTPTANEATQARIARVAALIDAATEAPEEIARKANVNPSVIDQISDGILVSDEDIRRVSHVLGFSEEGQQFNVRQTIEVDDPRGKAASLGHNDINVGLQNNQIIINAAVDKASVDKLIGMIERMKDLLD